MGITKSHNATTWINLNRACPVTQVSVQYSYRLNWVIYLNR